MSSRDNRDSRKKRPRERSASHPRKRRLVTEDGDVEMRPVYERERDRGRKRERGCDHDRERERRQREPSFSNMPSTSSGITRSNPSFSKDEMKALMESRPSTSYYRVDIAYGFLIGKSAALEAIERFLHPLKFHPFRVVYHEKSFVFLVDDIEVAKKLIDGSGNIRFPGGRRLNISVAKFEPRIRMNDFTMKTIISVLKRRLDIENNCLDLSNFQHDQEFLEKHMLCPLHDLTTLRFIRDVLDEMGVARNIVGLYLDRNKFNKLDGLKSLISKLTSLQAIHLEYNRIDKMEQLYAIRSHSIRYLSLLGNPFLASGKYSSFRVYVRNVKVYFPFLKSLDGAPTSETFPGDNKETNQALATPESSISRPSSLTPPTLSSSDSSSDSSPAQYAPITEKENKISYVCFETGMNREYSMLCLEESDWSIENAINRFHSAFDRIPEEAFKKEDD